LILLCIQFYIGIQAAVQQPADILGDNSKANKFHNKIDLRCRTSSWFSRRKCNCCGTSTFFVEYGTVCRRYCLKEYNFAKKQGKQGRKIDLAMNCNLQNGYNITAQDANDNLYPLRPSLVPAKSVTCLIGGYEVPLIDIHKFKGTTTTSTTTTTTTTTPQPKKDCKWGQWNNWSKCSKTCGNGFRTRRRDVQQFAINGGQQCQQDQAQQSEQCNSRPCKTIPSTQDNSCKTLPYRSDSPLQGSNKPCIFPFKAYVDQEKQIVKTINGCTTELCGEDCSRYWCSTKVDNNGFHIKGNWGYCDTKCPKDQPKDLICFGRGIMRFQYRSWCTKNCKNGNCPSSFCVCENLPK